MKYCPHCDMEFIDEVEVCTDCGRPLVDREEYLKEAAEKKEKAREAAKEAAARAAEVEAESLREEQQELEQLEELAEAQGRVRPPVPAPGVYVTRADRYEDLRSSASAFRLVGVFLFIVSILAFGDILHLPIHLPANPVLRVMLPVLTAGAFFISVKTSKDAAEVKNQIPQEEDVTERLKSWFLETYTPELVDEAVRRDYGDDLQPELLALKRMNYIQDCFITHYDLADQGYVDALAEDVYAKLFEKG